MASAQITTPVLYRVRYRLADDPGFVAEALLPVPPGDSSIALAEARFGADAVVSVERRHDPAPPVARFLHGRFHAVAPQDEPLLQGLCS